MPLYGFFDTRLRGNPVEVHGLRHGTTPLFKQIDDLLGNNRIDVHFRNLRSWLGWLQENRFRCSPVVGWN